jgi:hypothetical protein
MSEVIKPSFLLTYYNPFNKDAPGLVQSYFNYLKDVNLVDYASQKVAQSIENASKEQIKALNVGFNMLDQRLTRIINEQTATNLLLEDIKELLKIPDSEKQKNHHINQGVKFLSQISVNSSFVGDAIKEFEAAKKISHRDWFVLYNLGLLYLFYPEKFDIEKARLNFIDSLKYAVLDKSFSVKKSYLHSIQSSKERNWELENKTFGVIYRQFEDETSVPYFHISDTCLSLALIDYIQGDFDNAVSNCTSALSTIFDLEIEVPIHPLFLSKLYFFKAKYSCRANNQNSKQIYLDIEKCLNPNYSGKVLSEYCDTVLMLGEAIIYDADFMNLNEFNSVLTRKIEDSRMNVERIKSEKEYKEIISGIDRLIDYFFTRFLLFQSGLNYGTLDAIWGIAIFFDKYEEERYDISSSSGKAKSRIDTTNKIVEMLRKEIDFKLLLDKSKEFSSLMITANNYWRDKSDKEWDNSLNSQNPKDKKDLLNKRKRLDEILCLLPPSFTPEFFIKTYLQNGGMELLKSKGYIREYNYFIDKFQLTNYTPAQQKSKQKKEGCYIATAVYGSYDAPEVLVLRQFRDQTLQKYALGRLFISAYYFISPKLIGVIKNNSSINSSARVLLDRIVNKLKVK